MPPMPKQKMRLSMSNPVVCAKSNRLGGFQYSGTKSGSVRPNGVVNRLAHHIVLRCCGNAAYAASHGARNALDQTSQTYCSGSILISCLVGGARRSLWLIQNKPSSQSNPHSRASDGLNSRLVP